MNTITFNHSTACLLLNNEDQSDYIDYAFINKFRFENGMLENGELINEIDTLLNRNDVKKVSFLPMLKTHLNSMINEYWELGYFTYNSAVILSDIAAYTPEDYTDEIIKFLNMYENISNHAGMPVIKELYNQMS